MSDDHRADNSRRSQSAPSEPLTPTAEAMAQMHEWYTGMREAGFTLNEAAAIIAAVIAGHNQNGEQAA